MSWRRHAKVGSRLKKVCRSSGFWVLYSTLAAVCHGQLSFTSTMDKALESSPRVKIAEQDLKRATAAMSETKDAFIPTITGSAGLGASSGITLSVPTIFTVNAQSLVFNFSQRYSIRAARLSVEAACQSLLDIRQQVEEDAATTYLTLDIERKRQAVISNEYDDSTKLVAIVADRVAAGIDSELELKKARRTRIQIRLERLKLDDHVRYLSDHLAQLTGFTGYQIEIVSESVPPDSMFSSVVDPSPNDVDTHATLSLAASAQAKYQLAKGDARYISRPQVSFEAQYGRISPFNGVSDYYNLHGNYNTFAAGVQIRLPFLDFGHRAIARETQSDSVRSAQQVVLQRDQENEVRLQLQYSIRELAAQVELAQLDWEIAHDELSAILLQQEQSTSSTARPMSPKDEQSTRIQERQRYLSLLDVELQLRTAEISLLYQSGQLDAWLESLEPKQSQPLNTTRP